MMSEDWKEQGPLDQAAEMAARSVRAAGQAGKLAHSMIGAAAGGVIGETAVGILVTSKTFWKVALSIFLSVLLFAYVIVNAVGIVLSYLGFSDASSYVMQARTAEYQNIKTEIDTLFSEDVQLKQDVLSLISAQRDALKKEIAEDYSDDWESYDGYEVEDEYETVLKPNVSQYLAVLMEETLSGSQIVEFNGYGGEVGEDSELNTVPKDHAVSAALLKTFVEEQAGTFLDWTQTGTHTETRGSGEEEEEIEIVDYAILVKINPQLSELQMDHTYRYCTDETSFAYILRLFQVAQYGKEGVQDLLFRATSWKNHVIGTGTSEDIGTGNIETEGDTIVYETVTGCVEQVVYYNQGEEPWASLDYGGSTIRVSGCGPTALAIVISTLTGNQVTPQMTSQYAVANGLYVKGKGTSHAFPSMAAKKWGLSVVRVRREQIHEVVRELKRGKMAVVICAENTISKNGHFIVLTGVTTDGYITIADPASRSRTGKQYSPGTIQSYARSLADGSIWIIGE